MFGNKSDIARLVDVLKDITNKMYYSVDPDKLNALVKHSEYTNQSLQELIKSQPVKE